MKLYIFIYASITSNKLYITNLQSSIINGAASYTYISCKAVTISDWVKLRPSPSNQPLNSTAFTNIKTSSNLYQHLKAKFKPLKHFDIRSVNLEQGLFDLQDLMLGNDLKFINPYQEKKIKNCLDKLDESLGNIGTGDRDILLSLVFLLASIQKSWSKPLLPATTIYTYF